MWLSRSFLIDESGQTETAGTVLHGPFDTAQEAEEWADKFLPGVDSSLMYMNSPFFDEAMSEAFATPLVKKI